MCNLEDAFYSTMGWYVSSGLESAFYSTMGWPASSELDIFILRENIFKGRANVWLSVHILQCHEFDLRAANSTNLSLKEELMCNSLSIFYSVKKS
jgi:hypothetical protein